MRTQRLLTPIALAAMLAAGACKETVVKVLAVASVEVSGSSGPLMVGQSAQLNASPRDDRNTALTNRTITWSSSNPSVVSVSGSGLVQAAATGSATITASIEGVNGSLALSVNNPAPSVTSLAPNSIAVGSAAFQLNVTGSGFVPASVVVFNGQDRATTYVDGSTLRASITAADVATTGSFNVTVRNPQPGGGSSAAAAFAVSNPAPVIASLSPSSAQFGGAAFQLTVTGTGFMPNSIVRWKGQDRVTTYVNATTLRVSVAAADIAVPALVDVIVFNPTPGGGPSAPGQFIARIPPPGPTISTRGDHTCAVRANGEAYCWARNDSGQLGDGTTTDRMTPTRVSTTLPFVSVVTGLAHSCGLTSWGAAYCWGAGSYLGTGTSTSSTTPVAVTGGLAFVQIAAGSVHTCGVTAAGALYCWGDNYWGRLGDGSTTNRLAPVAVGAGQAWRRVIPGYGHTCAIATDGRMFCWGYNSSGQLGDGTTTNHNTPAPVSGSLVFSGGAAGSFHSCGIVTGGAAYCWGMGGRLGNATGAASSTPVAVGGGALFTAIAAANYQTCAVTQAGAAYCWGYSDGGQIGDGQVGTWDYLPVALNVPALRDISAGELHSCGIATTGTAYCWGERGFGGLGDGQSSLRLSPTAVTGAGSGYAGVTVGSQISCGLSGTSVQCWGHNSLGQMGDGTSTDHLVPGPVSGGYGFAQVTAGQDFVCARTSAGTAYCWGYGARGQLGNGLTSNTSAPSLVSGGYTFSDISAGGYHVCGVTSAGGVVCWGYNFYGEIGDGSTTMRTAPTPISLPGQVFARASAGYNHTCALTRAGQVYCWGWNSYGQLGDSTETNRPTPVAGRLPAAAVWLSAGVFATCAVTADNAAYCWGFNGVGELGTGSYGGTNYVLTPMPVSGGLAWRKIVQGYQTTCGLTTGSVAYCLGLNDWGRAGTGGLYAQRVPTAVTGGGTYADISVGWEHTCGLTTAGGVACWGRNRFGELGLGIAGIVPAPAPVQGGVVFDQNTCVSGTCTQATSPVATRRQAPVFGGVRPLVPAQQTEPVGAPALCTSADEPCPPVPLRLVR